MFGSDTNQQHGMPTTVAPAVNDDMQQNGAMQPEAMSDAQQPFNDTAPIGDPNSVFPPAAQDNSDPFGTASPAGPVASDDSSNIPAVEGSEALGADEKLLDIKQQALQHLSPLVQHLDQLPEEKFKTTMMMIQAADDKALVPAAFEAAKQIQDDKARAQALLDVINEINYFTQGTV